LQRLARDGRAIERDDRSSKAAPLPKAEDGKHEHNPHGDGEGPFEQKAHPLMRRRADH
jgi:hypothetical protein